MTVKTEAKAEDKEIKDNDIGISHLIDLVVKNKATAQDKKELARLLEEQAKQEGEADFQKKVVKIKSLMDSEGVSLEDLTNALNGPKQPTYVYVDKAGETHNVHGSVKGRVPAWLIEMKERYTEAQALELADSDEGKTWVKNVYKKK